MTINTTVVAAIVMVVYTKRSLVGESSTQSFVSALQGGREERSMVNDYQCCLWRGLSSSPVLPSASCSLVVRTFGMSSLHAAMYRVGTVRGGEIIVDTCVATESAHNSSDHIFEALFDLAVGGANQQRLPGDRFHPAGKTGQGSGTEMELLRRRGDTEDRKGVSTSRHVRGTDYCNCVISV